MPKHSGLNTKDTDLQKDLAVDGRALLKMELEEIMCKGKCVNWIHLAHNMGPVEASCEYSNTISRSIKKGKFLQYLNNN